MLEIVFALLMQMQPHHSDTESRSEREARMHVVAQAITNAVELATCKHETSPKDCKPRWKNTPERLAVLLLTQGHFESHYAQRIHAGNCKPKECDRAVRRDPKNPKRILRDKAGKKLYWFRARNVWQVQPSPGLHKTWQKTLGDGVVPTTWAAILMAEYFTRRTCRGNVAHTFQAMDGQKCRNGKRGRERSTAFHALLGRYRALKAVRATERVATRQAPH